MGTYFDYVPGRLDARFRQTPPFDYVALRLRMHSERILSVDCDDDGNWGEPLSSRVQTVEACVFMTSVFCPFQSYLRFLEAITTMVHECAFEWDAEGPMGRMEWRQRFIDDTGFLTVQWSEWDKYPRLRDGARVMLNTRQAVRMLYQAFRRWVESPEYNPALYEEGAGQGWGANLRELRSQVVETWLAQPGAAAAEPAGTAASRPGPSENADTTVGREGDALGSAGEFPGGYPLTGVRGGSSGRAGGIQE